MHWNVQRARWQSFQTPDLGGRARLIIPAASRGTIATGRRVGGACAEIALEMLEGNRSVTVQDGACPYGYLSLVASSLRFAWSW